MNFPFLKFPIRDFDKIESLQQLRLQLLNLLLLIAFAVGSVLYVVALFPLQDKGLASVPLIYSLLYVWLALVTFLRRLPYPVRAGSWLLFFYLLGTINLVLSGFNVDAGLCFLTFVSMTALLFDLRRGMVALGISSATILLAGYAVVAGDMRLQLGLPQSEPLLWVIGGLIFLATGILLILSLTVLVRGLLVNLTKATTEAEQLEETNQALRASEERYRSLVEISPDLVTLIGLDGKIILTNRPGLALFRYETVEQVAGDDFLSFIAPEDRPRLAQAFQQTLDSGSAGEIIAQCIRKDGTLFHVEFSASRILDGNGAPQAVISVGRDITERRQAEQALQNAKEQLERRVLERTAELQSASERLRELVSRSPAVIFAAQVGKNYPATFYSENVRDLLGYSPRDFTADPNFWAERIHPQDAERVFTEIERIFETGEVTLEYRFLHQDGEYCWMRDAVRLVRDPDGTPRELVGSRIDVTAQKQAEVARIESEEKYKSLVENVNIGIFQSTLDGKFIHANSAVAAMAGYANREEFLRLPAQTLYADLKDREFAVRQLRQDGFVKNFEARSRRQDGSLYWISMNAVLLPDKDGNLASILGSVTDITDRKRMQQSLADAKDELEARVAERTRELTESREQLRNLTTEVVHAQEEERRKVSRELHDEAGQALVSMKYGLESILSELPKANAPIRSRLALAIQQLDQTMEQIRHLAHSLRPPLFDIADLDLTLKDYCREFGEATGLRIEYRGVPVPGLPEQAGLSFFRFLQEALTNVVKHANASRAQVELEKDAGNLSLTVADNGAGKTGNLGEGQGHRGMRERFRMLDGQVQVRSRGRAGFVITASIPWTEGPGKNAGDAGTFV